MPFDSNIHHRRSIRLKGYDYSQAGLYFITICCSQSPPRPPATGVPDIAEWSPNYKSHKRDIVIIYQYVPVLKISSCM